MTIKKILLSIISMLCLTGCFSENKANDNIYLPLNKEILYIPQDIKQLSADVVFSFSLPENTNEFYFDSNENMAILGYTYIDSNNQYTSKFELIDSKTNNILSSVQYDNEIGDMTICGNKLYWMSGYLNDMWKLEYLNLSNKEFQTVLSGINNFSIPIPRITSDNNNIIFLETILESGDYKSQLSYVTDTKKEIIYNFKNTNAFSLPITSNDYIFISDKDEDGIVLKRYKENYNIISDEQIIEFFVNEEYIIYISNYLLNGDIETLPELNIFYFKDDTTYSIKNVSNIHICDNKLFISHYDKILIFDLTNRDWVGELSFTDFKIYKNKIYFYNGNIVVFEISNTQPKMHILDIGL